MLWGRYEPADWVLIRRMAKGDNDALMEFCDRHYVMVYGMAFRILEDGPDAQSALYEVFVTAYLKAGEFRRGGGSGEAWLLDVANEVILAYLRRRRERGRAEPQATSDQSDKAETEEEEMGLIGVWRRLTRHEQMWVIRKAFGERWSDEQDVIERVTIHRQSLSRVARARGETLETAWERFASGAKAIRRYLETGEGDGVRGDTGHGEG